MKLEQIVEKEVTKLSKKLSKINYDKKVLEITPLNAIKFILQIGDHTLSIIKPLLDDTNNVIFNLYINKELLISDETDIDNLIKGIKKHIEI